ncbi:MAG: pitrilysin family protein [Verrucomicrobiota bacterium]|nr:pitrilysin family protein [Verrucomicrobiota bacterium]
MNTSVTAEPVVSASKTSSGKIDVPSLNARLIVFDNGFSVVIKEDRSAPVVSCQMWVNTGSIHEGKWMGAGLSHILEHMLFKGTSTRSNSQIALTIQDYGGYVNAYTSYDRTVYHIDGPSKGWDIFTEVLADAMRNSTLPAEEYDKEQEVIRREFAMGYDNPDRMLGLLLFEQAYSIHPYRYPVIGHKQIYDRLTRQDVLEYYKLKYVPQNITYVIVGDVDGQAVEEKMRKLVSDWKRGPLPPDLIPTEPRQLGKREVHRESNVNISRIEMAWHIPSISHPDMPALDILAYILGQGRSSRLYKELRDKRAIVKSIESFSYTPAYDGLFGVSAMMDPDKRAQVEEAVDAEIKKLQGSLVSEAEVSKAKRSILVGQLNSRRTMAGMAAELGSNYFMTRDLSFTKRYLDAIQKVTREDLQRVARAYLIETGQTVVSSNPMGSLKNIGMESKAVEDKPIQKFELPNGIRLLVKEDARLPFVSIRTVSMGGILAENPDNNGISRLTSRLLIKGTKSRSAEEIADAIENAGGSISSESGSNSSSVAVEVLKSDFKLGLDIAADVFLNPAFSSAAVEREKLIQLADIQTEKEQPMALARINLLKTLYPAHPYGMNALGTEQSVKALTPEALSGHHRRFATGKNTVISVFGDVNAEDVKAAVTKAFGALPTGDTSLVIAHQTVPPLVGGKSVREAAEKNQAILFFGFNGVDMKSKDRNALEILEEASSDLGSRFFIRIRENMGLAYFVGARQMVGYDPGYFFFYVGTDPGKIDSVQTEMLNEIKLLADKGLTDDEFKRAKTKLTGSQKVENQNLAGLAYKTALDELYGEGYNHYLSYDKEVEAVTKDQVTAAARKYLGTPNMATIIVSPTPQPKAPTPPNKK